MSDIRHDADSHAAVARAVEMGGNGVRSPVADSRETRIASCAIAALLTHYYRTSPP